MGVARKKSILSGITGKIGPMVLSKMRNIEVVKAVPTPPKKGSHTSDQAKQRAFFNFAHKFLLGVGYDVPRIGYQLTKKKGMSKSNAAMQDLMLNAIKGEYPDFSIDYSKVKMSSPIHEIDACWNGHCIAGDGITIEVTWEQNPFPGKTTRSHDCAAIVFYDETWGRNIYREMNSRKEVHRGELKWSYKGFSKLIGHNIHCWMFFVSGDGKRVSQSEYLGMVTLKP
jgi:hypothetical protein